MTPSTGTAPDCDLSDAALAEHAGAGDERAFEALDRRHRSALLRHCNRILRNSHDAEEAVQGALLKAYRALASGQRPASVLPWLMVIARNESFDIIRARLSTEQLPLDIESSAIRPDELVMRREDARVLRADLKELPQAQRAALVLRSMGDLPHAEIARLLGGTAADARTLCHEARSSLVECQEGRDLECVAVLERIETGDGRALRARRIRAHLRACDGCRSAAEGIRAPHRSGLGALFPLPWLAALRSLLFGGGSSGGAGTAGAIGGVGSATLIGVPIVAVVTALAVGVSVQEGRSAPAPAPSSTYSPSPSVTPATSTPPASVMRATRRSPSVEPSSPGTGTGTGSPTPTAAASVSTPKAAEAATAAQPVPGLALSVPLQIPVVRVPGTGVTVPSVELPPASTSAQTPAGPVPALGLTVPSVQLPSAPAAGAPWPARVPTPSR